MTNKHTPGPWAVGSRETSGIKVYSKSATNFSQLGKTLAFVSAPVVPAKKGESEEAYQVRRAEIEDANARLIAAAPDLLAALASIETKARELADDSMQSNRGLWLACADEARAALGKAGAA